MSAFQQFMSTVTNASITISALELTFVIVALTSCLVFRFPRTGLIVAYLFCYKNGWTVMLQHSPTYVAGYMCFGILVGVVSVIGMLKSDN